MFTILLSYVWTINWHVESTLSWHTANSMDEEVWNIKPVEWMSESVLSLSSGDLGDRWRYGHVTVQSYSSFQVAFEGTVGNGVQVRFQY